MGYERNDRRLGSSNERYGYGGYGSERGRASGDYGQGRRDYRGDRQAEWRDRDRWDQSDRGFFDRAGDEVRSWFGDEEAERRRRRDEAEAEREYRSRYGSQGYRPVAGNYGDDPGYGIGVGGVAGSEYNAAYEPGRRDRNDDRRDHDYGYRSWRDRQMEAFDRDYDEYRRENQSRFDAEFSSWRQQRASQRELLGKVKEHQEVVGSDGKHIGTVDHVRGDRILLTKADQAAGGHHHSIPLSWIQAVDEKVQVGKTAEEAQAHWRDEERGQRGAFGWADDSDRRTDLNRSFSGTY